MALDNSKFDYQIVDETTTPDTEINLFAFNEQQPVTRLLPLRPVKQETGDPIETRPESGDVHGQNDFRGGMGQKLFHRQGRDETAYFHSEGIDISEEGQIGLTKNLTEVHASSVDSGFVVIAGTLFYGSGTTVRKTSDLSAFSTEDPHAGEGAQSVVGMASDGRVGYAALTSNGIHQRSAAGVWSHYVAAGTSAQAVAWFKDRLLAIGDTSGLRTLYEIDPSGPTANVVSSLGGFREADDSGAWMAEAGPFLYVALADSGDDIGKIKHFGLNSGGTAIEPKGETLLPEGDTPTAICSIFGLLIIGAKRSLPSGGGSPLLYAGIPQSSGELSLVLIAEHEMEDNGTLFKVKGMTVVRNKVYMLWRWENTLEPYASDDFDGTAIYDPVREAFCVDMKASASQAGTLNSIGSFLNRIIVGGSSGLEAEDTSTLEESGFLLTSMADWNNAGQKYWDQLEVTLRPLPVNCTIVVSYTTDDPADAATSFTTLGTISLAGTRSQKLSLGFTGRRLTLKFGFTTLNGPSTPTLLSYSVRSYPKPETQEYLLKRYVKIAKQGRARDSGKAQTQRPRTLRKQLLGYAHAPRLTFEEADATWSVRITDIQDVEPGQPEAEETNAREQKEFYVMELTMEGTLVE